MVASVQNSCRSAGGGSVHVGGICSGTDLLLNVAAVHMVVLCVVIALSW